MTSDFIPLMRERPSDAPTRRSSRGAGSAHRGSPASPQWTRDDDRTLIRGLLNHEPAAWHEFIRRYERLFVSQISATCRETGHAIRTDLVDDCGAEVMAALIDGEMSGLRKFEGRSKLSTWLSIVIRRTTLAFLRKRERDTVAALQPDSRFDLQMVPDRKADVAEVDVEDRDRLRACLQQLSDSDRKILAFHFDLKWSYAEIANKLGITENAVGPKLHRARSRLKVLVLRSSPRERG